MVRIPSGPALGLAVLAALSGAAAARAQAPLPQPAPLAPPADGAAAGQAAGPRILQPPPLQWDRAMLASRPALVQTATDFANLTGGFAFGMTPTEANARLPEPYVGLSWSALPVAGEYPGEVRYFWTRLDAAGPLVRGLAPCAGAGSTIVFIFNSRGLFRLSYRLVPDKACSGADVAEAARGILARYVSIGQSVALSARYRSLATEVVDVTDPTAGSYLAQVRYRQGGL